MSGRRQSAEPKAPPGPWAQLGNCLGLPQSWFFPERGENRDTSAAKRVCAGCEVREECLEYAMSPPIEMTGVWGGTTARQRSRMRRDARRRSA